MALERKNILVTSRAAELRELFGHHEYPWTSAERDAYERIYAVALVDAELQAAKDRERIGADAYEETSVFQALTRALSKKAPRSKSELWSLIAAPSFIYIAAVLPTADNRITSRPPPHRRYFESLSLLASQVSSIACQQRRTTCRQIP